MIRIFPADETVFADNGLKILHPFSAVIRKEDNGDYYIDIESPIEEMAYLQEGYIVYCDTPWGQQGFRLTNPDKKMHRVSVKGWHLYYDAERYVVPSASVTGGTCSAALTAINGATDSTSPFTVSSDISGTADLTATRVSLQDAIESCIETWGGHLVRDNWSIALNTSIGQDNGISIAYGKNLQDLQITDNWDDVCTKVLPVGKDDTLLDAVYLSSATQYDVPYTKVVSFSQDINESDYDNTSAYTAALKADLQTQAQAYLDAHAVPEINYKMTAHIPDTITDIGDTIYADHPGLSMSITATVIALTYDLLLDRLESIEFGNFKKRLSGLLPVVQSTISSAILAEKLNVAASVTVTSGSTVALSNGKEYVGSGISALTMTMSGTPSCHLSIYTASSGGITITFPTGTRYQNGTAPTFGNGEHWEIWFYGLNCRYQKYA